ncbi:hypothetical protein [Chryseobacterium sp.]|uniref:hypothetical protein n=1 Tax=Chryseobacterium sp. TaxID=1871047 RepID=UPI0025BADE41|nr:hypothetical protein [Chryseobacterium sp.]MBV8325983.1 hypothetical protein [Chryseobacterium sp.]
MNLYKKNFIIILSFLFSVLFSQPRKQPINLSVKGDFTHEATSVIFPPVWSGFQREAIYSYDLKNRHLAISYIQQKDKKTKTTLTLYIYPKISIDNQRLRDSFTSYEYALNQNSDKGTELKPLFGSISNDQLKVNYIYSLFSHSMGQADFFKGVKYVEKNSLLSIYECGGWDFKIRVSSDDMTDEQLAGLKNKIESYFGILQIASRNPLPVSKIPDIILSPTVKRDSMMANSAIAAAQAKIYWLGKNLEQKELLTGFNDMRIDSEVFAIEKMVEFYKLHEKDWPMHDDTKKYFNEMVSIVDNGKIKDHIYEKYNKVINYEEGSAARDAYLRFKSDQNISENTNEILYKIYYRLE